MTSLGITGCATTTTSHPTAAKYFALSLCCNNNMARFNASFKFNQTFGRRTWNSSTTEKVSRYIAHTRAYRSRVRLARELHRGATQRGLPDGRQENAPGPWRGLRGVPENTGRLRGTDPAALSWRDIESNSAGLDLEHHISERQRCPASSPGNVQRNPCYDFARRKRTPNKSPK